MKMVDVKRCWCHAGRARGGGGLAGARDQDERRLARDVGRRPLNTSRLTIVRLVVGGDGGDLAVRRGDVLGKPRPGDLYVEP